MNIHSVKVYQILNSEDYGKKLLQIRDCVLPAYRTTVPPVPVDGYYGLVFSTSRSLCDRMLRVNGFWSSITSEPELPR
jgi:hypothetical protein